MNVGVYIRNGIVEKVKEVFDVKYKTLEESLMDIDEHINDCDLDFENMDKN